MSQTKKIIKSKKYNQLTALHFSRKNKHLFWMFKCDCGEIKEIRTDSIYTGKVVSCGCHKNKNIQKVTHGKSKTPEYKIWVGIKMRCFNKNNTAYNNYGGRGIKVCARWMNFENFYKDMGERPSKKHSIDRVDVDGNYEPDNCRWATREIQLRNKRTNVRVNLDGENICIAELADKFNINYDCLYKRIVILKWDVKKAIINHNFNYKYV